MPGKREFAVQFPLRHAHKDMRLAVLAGGAPGVPTPVTAAAYRLFAVALARGFARPGHLGRGAGRCGKVRRP